MTVKEDLRKFNVLYGDKDYYAGDFTVMVMKKILVIFICVVSLFVLLVWREKFVRKEISGGGFHSVEDLNTLYYNISNELSVAKYKQYWSASNGLVIVSFNKSFVYGCLRIDAKNFFSHGEGDLIIHGVNYDRKIYALWFAPKGGAVAARQVLDSAFDRSSVNGLPRSN